MRFEIRIPIGAMGECDTGYIFGEDFKFEKSAFYLRSQLNAAETDFSVSVVGFQKHLLAGWDLARGIGGAGFWLEAAYVFADSFGQGADTAGNYLRASTGLDYSFGGKDLRIHRISFQWRRRGRCPRITLPISTSQPTPKGAFI